LREAQLETADKTSQGCLRRACLKQTVFSQRFCEILPGPLIPPKKASLAS